MYILNANQQKRDDVFIRMFKQATALGKDIVVVEARRGREIEENGSSETRQSHAGSCNVKEKVALRSLRKLIRNEDLVDFSEI